MCPKSRVPISCWIKIWQRCAYFDAIVITIKWCSLDYHFQHILPVSYKESQWKSCQEITSHSPPLLFFFERQINYKINFIISASIFHRQFHYILKRGIITAESPIFYGFSLYIRLYYHMAQWAMDCLVIIEGHRQTSTYAKLLKEQWTAHIDQHLWRNMITNLTHHGNINIKSYIAEGKKEYIDSWTESLCSKHNDCQVQSCST